MPHLLYSRCSLLFFPNLLRILGSCLLAPFCSGHFSGDSTVQQYLVWARADLPYPALPYPDLPYPTLTCPDLPYPALPYPDLP